MKDDPKENDRSEYTDTGFRDPDRREGFGDDGGTRVGRPDGAASNASAADPNGGGARVAPENTQGPPRPGQPSTNTEPVADGVEGSEVDATEGGEQARVRKASEGLTPGPAQTGDRPTYDL